MIHASKVFLLGKGTQLLTDRDQLVWVTGRVTGQARGHSAWGLYGQCRTQVKLIYTSASQTGGTWLQVRKFKSKGRNFSQERKWGGYFSQRRIPNG